MLEFQKEFFEQEIRDGFYLDVTMKTLWAAELELLNKIAEVCARYNLKWYAAYGSLLGAIRHEGFVPWDDDMDIVMLRKDYNTLMQVLPKELPDGYRVRGPQTDEGYDQFHTCVNNGSGISIAKDWLEANHNCPFTVGIDIFPLDYLPRNKKDRELQKSIFILVGRVAQLAKNLARGDYDLENSSITRTEAITQIKDGLRYLDKNYKFKINKQWLIEEEWGKITSEVWKWGNYVASLYGEDEADYLVEYLDWVRWKHKKFPKSWFEDGYSATFENVMLPIPSGYHEFLSQTYGDYMRYKPKGGFHEYPFYARQLRQLRKYIQDIENQAVKVGLCDVGEITVEEASVLPSKWKDIIFVSEEKRKKILLMSDCYEEFTDNPKDKIASIKRVIKAVENSNDDIVLWWRPLEKALQILKNVDADSANEYKEILEQFRKSKLNICDETDNYERAAFYCDAYYGGMNAVIQTVQNMNKPVIVNNPMLDAREENEHRKKEMRIFPAYTSYVDYEGRRYYPCNNFNALVVQEIETGLIENIIPLLNEKLEGQNAHVKCTRVGEWMVCVPYTGRNLHLINLKSGEMQVCEIVTSEKEGVDIRSWDYFADNNKCYILPNVVGEDMYCFSCDDEKLSKVSWWHPFNGEGNMIHKKMDENSFFTYVVKENVICVTNLIAESVSTYKLPHQSIELMVFDGTDFWYTITDSSNIYRWNIENSDRNCIEIDMDEEYWTSRGYAYYVGMYYTNNSIILIPQNGTSIYLLDTITCEMRMIHRTNMDINTYTFSERTPYVVESNDSISVYYRNVNYYTLIDKSDFTCKDILFEGKGVILEQYESRLLFLRAALMHMDRERMDLDNVLNYLRG